MAQIDRSEGLVGSTGIKAPVRAATTANITLSGEQTIDGVACVAGDRVLVKNQTTGSKNGIWVVSTGSWNRSGDFDGSYDAEHGSLILVTSGNTYANFVFQLTTDNPVIGTSSLTFIDQTPSSLASLAASSGSSLVGFIQAGTGAVVTTVQGKLRESVSLEDFGAVGDGSTDDTTAITAALATGFPIKLRSTGNYKITSTITIPNNTTIIGNIAFGNNTNLPRFTGTGAITVFKAPENSGAGLPEILGWNFREFNIFSGSIQINLPNGGVGWVMRDVSFIGPSTTGIQAAGFKQDWFFQGVEFSGGQYGMDILSAAGSQGATSLFDKMSFKDVDCHGQTVNAIRLKSLLGNTVVWDKLVLFGSAQDAMIIDGGFRYMTFLNIGTESAGGYTGTAPLAPTTGTINSGTATLTVASATGLVNGQTLTIAGAGASGADLVSVINNIVGTTITLANNASTSVTNAETVNYIYSCIKFTNSVATPASIQFIGGNLGSPSAVSSTRYAIDATGLGDGYLLDLSTSRPVYDPFSVFSGTSINAVMRKNLPITSESFQVCSISLGSSRNVIPSPNGKNLILVLRDSLGNSTGTYGDFELRKYNPNRDSLFSINGTDGSASFWGYISPGGFGAGTGANITPSSNRICYGNAVPTAGSWYAGDIIFNQTPSVAQPKGWTCTVSGTPGTWVSQGNL